MGSNIEHDPTPGALISLYQRWESTPSVANFLTLLRVRMPEASEVELRSHALQFAESHMMAYLVGWVESATAGADPGKKDDRPGWLRDLEG